MTGLIEEPPPLPALPEEPNQEPQESVQAEIKRWLKRIVCAEEKWSPIFKQMRENMEFAAGLQWDGQKELRSRNYVSNMTLRMVNQKVATLYARNPEGEATVRKKRNYVIWDEKLETLAQAVEMAQQYIAIGLPVPMEIMALLADYEQGQQREQTMRNVCDTLQKAFQYQVDAHKPDFKEQMKQVVRRAVIAKVGYCRVYFCRDGDPSYVNNSSMSAKNSTSDRTARANLILDKIDEGEVEADSAQVETLKSLAVSLGATIQGDDEQDHLSERIEFDFLPPDSVIPDERVRNLKEFIGAGWIAIKYPTPLEEVNELFGVDIKPSTELKNDHEGQQNNLGDTEASKNPIVDLYEILDRKNKVRFFVCKGHKDYVLPPEPLYPAVAGFWPLFALTFNDIESVDGTKASPFPPSDVDLVRDAQMEWNRTRDALRDQRNANAPSYAVRKGALTEGDINRIKNRVPNSVLELESIPPDQKPGDFLSVVQVAAIDPALYNTEPLAEDMMLSSGMQEANMGAAQPNVTATVGTIAEQSRMTVAASNIDDLDAFLSRIYQAGGEMMLRGFSRETITQIVGPGAVFPEEDRQDYLNEINLQIKAASSGRPNKALEISNFQTLVPFLLQAGANPQAIIREGMRRLDEQIDASEFFPLPGAMGIGTEQQAQQGMSGPPPREALQNGAQVVANY